MARFNNIKIPVVIFLLTGIFFTGHSQVFTNYTSTNSNLSYNTVRTVTIDSSGVLWAGTDHGLSYFDGTNWNAFYTTNSNIPSNAIRCLAVDSLNNLWVGTMNDGIGIFDGSNWSYINTSNSGISDNSIKYIAFDKNNELWVCTIYGLNHFDGTNWSVYNVFNSILWTNNISTITFDDFNNKYVGTVNGGLTIIDNNDNVTVYNSYNSDMVDNTVLSLDYDISGLLWMATPSGGLVARNVNNQWLWYNTEGSDIPSNALNDVLVSDIDQTKYIASQDKGLIVFENFLFNYYSTSNSNIAENYIYDLVEDSLGNIWMGTYSSGVIKFNKNALSINESIIYSPSDLKTEIINTFVSTEHPYLKYKNNSESHYTVFDVSGKMIQTGKIQSNNGVIKLTSVEPGYYFIQFAYENKQASSFKFFVE